MKSLTLLAFFLMTSSYSFAKDSFDDGAIAYSNSNVCKTVKDPLEKINRKLLYFNGAVDYVTLYPTAKIYDRFLSSPIKKAINNFTSNLDQPYSAVSSIAQGKMENSLLNFWSFLINSTLGIGGIGDVASSIGIKPKNENIANILAHYGAGPGPYIVLPILGPMTARDLPDKILRPFADPVEFISQDLNLLIFIVSTINSRAKLLPLGDYISSTSLDPYLSIRSMYIQKRENDVEYPVGFRCNH